MPSGHDQSLRPLSGARAVSRTAGARLELLGGFCITVGARAVRLPLNEQRLLGFLAVHGRPLHRAFVAGRLWSELSQEHAHSCLRTTLWRITRLPVAVVEATGTHLALRDSLSIDTFELEECVERVIRRAAAPAATDVHLLSKAGELLPDVYDDWVVQERERLHQLHVLALEAAGDRLLECGRHAEATILALAAVHADPLRETAQRLLIRSHLTAGNHSEAVRQYASFRARLDRELGLEPTAETAELLAAVAGKTVAP